MKIPHMQAQLETNRALIHETEQFIIRIRGQLKTQLALYKTESNGVRQQYFKDQLKKNHRDLDHARALVKRLVPIQKELKQNLRRSTKRSVLNYLRRMFKRAIRVFNKYDMV